MQSHPYSFSKNLTAQIETNKFPWNSSCFAVLYCYTTTFQIMYSFVQQHWVPWTYTVIVKAMHVHVLSNTWHIVGLVVGWLLSSWSATERHPRLSCDVFDSLCECYLIKQFVLNIMVGNTLNTHSSQLLIFLK